MKKIRSKRSLKRNIIYFSAVILIFTAIFSGLYLIGVYSNISFIKYWRAIWVETAMTTGDHQWLATNFIPKNIIDDIMKHQIPINEISGGLDYLETNPLENNGEPEKNENSHTVKPIEKTEPEVKDILNQENLKTGDKDYAGNTILVNDIEQGIIISEITGKNYKGKIMLIDDPSRVFVGTTAKKSREGQRIKEILERYDAVAGINASGFSDPNGQGSGADIIGMSCSNGAYWGEYVDYYGSVVLTKSNKLVVGNISIWEKYAIRDGIQFGPVLIADGEKQADGSNGFGIQPRTAIGQRKDGVIAFLVIDGRDILYSIGCTIGELADIFVKYEIINAACCDGGSSSILAYNNEVITKNCSANPAFGRRIPTAFLVKRKSP